MPTDTPTVRLPAQKHLPTPLQQIVIRIREVLICCANALSRSLGIIFFKMLAYRDGWKCGNCYFSSLPYFVEVTRINFLVFPAPCMTGFMAFCMYIYCVHVQVQLVCQSVSSCQYEYCLSVKELLLGLCVQDTATIQQWRSANCHLNHMKDIHKVPYILPRPFDCVCCSHSCSRSPPTQ